MVAVTHTATGKVGGREHQKPGLLIDYTQFISVIS